MTLGRCSLSIFCSRVTPHSPTLSLSHAEKTAVKVALAFPVGVVMRTHTFTASRISRSCRCGRGGGLQSARGGGGVRCPKPQTTLQAAKTAVKVALAFPVGAPIFKLPAFRMLTKTDPFASWFVVTGDAPPDGERVVQSVLGASSSLPIVVTKPQSKLQAAKTAVKVALAFPVGVVMRLAQWYYESKVQSAKHDSVPSTLNPLVSRSGVHPASSV